LLPAAISSGVAGVLWWLVVLVQATREAWPRLPGLLDIPRSIMLFELATLVPNAVGLAVLDWLAASWSPDRQRRFRRWWPVVGAAYGMAIQLIGIPFGLLVLLGPPWLIVSLVTPIPSLLSLVIPLILIAPLYPVAIVAGMVGVRASSVLRRDVD
jgi:hypothetical protein